MVPSADPSLAPGYQGLLGGGSGLSHICTCALAADLRWVSTFIGNFVQVKSKLSPPPFSYQGRACTHTVANTARSPAPGAQQG